VNCTDCAITALNVEPAIGICVHCGGGICLEHAHISAIRPHSVGLMLPIPGRRRLTCVVCSTRNREGASPAGPPKRS